MAIPRTIASAASVLVSASSRARLQVSMNGVAGAGQTISDSEVAPSS